MKKAVEVIAHCPVSILGEGVMWHPEEKVLYWVDITSGLLHRHNPASGQTQSLSMGCMIGTVVPSQGNYNVVVALESGIYGLTREGNPEKLAGFPSREIAGNRFNDGKCDPLGRFWVGTMNKQVQPGAGNLYCFDGKNIETKLSGLTISNGMAWSDDKHMFYFIDTADNAVWAFNFDLHTAVLSKKRKVIEVPSKMGSPDGMTIDCEGMLWIAHWGGSCIARWNPETGQLLEKVEVPAPHVTSCAFGGEDMQTLYITTASEGLAEQQMREYPLSGCVFQYHSGQKGGRIYCIRTQTSV